jgi:hypothetical protein
MISEVTSSGDRSSTGDRWLALVLSVLVLAVFGRAVLFPFVHWDDGLHVSENPVTLHPWAEGWRGLLLTPRLGYPVPVSQLSFCLDRLLFGLNAHAYHAENVCLHLANAFLVQRLGERLGLSRRSAYFAAALFAVHPLVVEPVCWVTGRKDLLAAALLLGALVVVSRDWARRGSLAIWTATGLAILAILAKPSTLVAPLLFVLVLRVARPEVGWRATAIPVAVLACCSAAAACLGLTGEVGAGAVRHRSLAEGAREIAGALTFQLGHLAWPVDLLPRYFRVPGEPSIGAMVAALLGVFAMAVVAVAAKPGSVGRTGLLFASIAYLPVSSIVGLNRWFADSYMYLPLVGLSWAATSFASRCWPPRLARIGLVLSSAAIALLGLVSVGQSLVWSSSSALWPAVVARYPTVPRAWALLASGELADGKSEEAERAYVRLHDEFPAYDGALVNQIYVYEKLGQTDVASDLWRRCLALRKEECVNVHRERALRGADSPDRERDDEAGK